MESSSVQIPIDKLYLELRDLKDKNFRRKAEIDKFGTQMDATIRDRDQLNAEVKRISDNVKDLKSKRDALNSQVKELKLKRDGLRAAASKKREALSKLLEQAGQISEQLQGNMSELSRQIKALEWYIQTNPLAPKAERSIIVKISALETSLAKHKGLRDMRDKLLRVKIEVGALRIQAQSTHEELTRIAEESEKVHTNMQELFKALAAKKKEADVKHSEFIGHSKERRERIAAFKKNLLRMEEIRSMIGEAKASTFKKGEILKSKYKETANEKLKTGGKLSFEEFQALMSDNITESQDE